MAEQRAEEEVDEWGARGTHLLRGSGEQSANFKHQFPRDWSPQFRLVRFNLKLGLTRPRLIPKFNPYFVTYRRVSPDSLLPSNDLMLFFFSPPTSEIAAVPPRMRSTDETPSSQESTTSEKTFWTFSQWRRAFQCKRKNTT